ncbi:MAG: MFS transporter [Holosporaceae bacterium]|jgi:PAT family beta-lactamase induction signal transducer AmpG|nr:MFS transporter [Holosporaceae bacterium]
MKFAFVFRDFVKTYLRPGISNRFFVGFTCGIPFLLRLTVLDLWLKESGLSNTIIGFFALLQWPYTLKFLWAPFIEKMDFPILSKIFGRRRGWAIASQIMLFIGLLGISTIDPKTNLPGLIFFVSFTAFADSCQDASIYAYQLDKVVSTKMLGPIAGIFIFGYKTGMFFSKSTTLYLAHYFGWNFAYTSMAFAIFFCTFFILFMDEPEIKRTNDFKRIEKMTETYQKKEKTRWEFVRIIKTTIFECLVCSFRIFIKGKNGVQTILLIMLYRAGDRMIQKMSKPFYVDMGFSKLEIANVVQVFGTIAVLLGGIIGGYVVKRLGAKKAMLWCGIFHAFGCFAYALLSYVGHNINMLYCTVFIENITIGTVSTAFLAFVYGICNKNYATTQYATLWAFFEFGSSIFKSFSGIIVDACGWTNFFLLTPFVFVPGLIILFRMIKNDNTLSGRH